MKVVYEISLLGRGLHDAKVRAGIHRVVENTFQGLNACSDIELRPISLVERDYVNTRAYLEVAGLPSDELLSCWDDA